MIDAHDILSLTGISLFGREMLHIGWDDEVWAGSWGHKGDFGLDKEQHL